VVSSDRAAAHWAAEGPRRFGVVLCDPPWAYLVAHRSNVQSRAATDDGGLFGPRPGWTFLGSAVDGQDMGDALRDLAHSRAAAHRGQGTLEMETSEC
jgi:hypothetical protein